MINIVTFNSLFKSDDIAVKSTYKNLDFVSNYTIEVLNLPRNYNVDQMKSILWSYFNTVSDNNDNLDEFFRILKRN